MINNYNRYRLGGKWKKVKLSVVLLFGWCENALHLLMQPVVCTVHSVTNKPFCNYYTLRLIIYLYVFVS